MNLINKQVTHKQFGKGNVVGLSDTSIEVHFQSGNKLFVFPDAFGTYLSLNDKRAIKFVKVLKEKRQEEQRKQEIILRKEKERLHEEHQHRLQREKILRNLRIHKSSQVVFWCDEEEQNRVFTEWNTFTGTSKSGKSKGEIRKIVRLHQNSACLLTARDSNMLEQDRRILGVYMVNEGFIGKLCEDGYISAHPKYRIRLSEEEAQKMLFWNYYVNEKYPHRMTWNAGLYRYVDNIWMAQILRDIISLKSKTSERDLAQQFFDYFCEMNKLDKNALPNPDGALMRNS